MLCSLHRPGPPLNSLQRRQTYCWHKPHTRAAYPATSNARRLRFPRLGMLAFRFDRPCHNCHLACQSAVHREGEEADNFYVIASGTFAATKAAVGDGAAGSIRVATYEGRGGFGELALMYNCPRAATVTGMPQACLLGFINLARQRIVGQYPRRHARASGFASFWLFA